MSMCVSDRSFTHMYCWRGEEILCADGLVCTNLGRYMYRSYVKKVRNLHAHGV